MKVIVFSLLSIFLVSSSFSQQMNGKVVAHINSSELSNVTIMSSNGNLTTTDDFGYFYVPISGTYTFSKENSV